VTILPAAVALIALERLIELSHAARNTRALKRRGAVEAGAAHYPLFVLLHAAWLGSLLVFVPWDTPPNWFWLGLMIALLALRLWVIVSLGPYWTTRIVTLPGAPLVRRGPYRFLNHPNYAVVTAEIAALPLAFGAYAIAITFSLANLALIAWRVRIEDRALAARRGIAAPPVG
jgi:methyltransferase